MSELIIGTKNVGKIKELEELLADLPVRLRSLNDFKGAVEPEETGATFSENAILKARSYALQTELPVLADDSGLEVEALGGAPGVLSARYAGAGADDAQRIEKLLLEINKTKDANRRARFVCVMAIADPAGETLFVAEGVCGGVIASKARGAGGFGYDPIFIPDGFSETFAELSGDMKQKISHRARASAKIIQYLRRFYAAVG